VGVRRRRRRARLERSSGALIDPAHEARTGRYLLDGEARIAEGVKAGVRGAGDASRHDAAVEGGEVDDHRHPGRGRARATSPRGGPGDRATERQSRGEKCG
jgi:hypothetical protein